MLWRAFPTTRPCWAASWKSTPSTSCRSFSKSSAISASSWSPASSNARNGPASITWRPPFRRGWTRLGKVTTLDGRARPVRRVLLVEANNMSKWVGSTMPYEGHIPPLGRMYVAASARQAHPEIEFRSVESSLPDLNAERLAKLLDEFQPDVVGIRSIAFFQEEMQRIATAVKAWGGALLVAGGPVVQAYKARLFDEVPELDLAVKGEGERVFCDLLSGAGPEQLSGVLYRANGGVVESPDSPEIGRSEEHTSELQ